MIVKVFSQNMVEYLSVKRFSYFWIFSGPVTDALQVLERDLAIFGFFIALGRSTQSFFSCKWF